MEQTNKDNIPGILVSLDFRKAFGTLEWSCIQHSLKVYNFGEGLRRWVKVFYSEIESAAINNGFATNWIKPSTGVRQGCPLSPYLFILLAEIMSNKIRQCNEVHGISLFRNEIKLSQFADDTNLLCSDLISVENGLQLIRSIGEISGLQLNIGKTKAMWLGKLANQKDKPLSLKWVDNPIRILGIFFSYDSKGNNKQNFDLKVQKLQTNLDMWRSRDLTLFGKVLIIKALGVPPLIFSASNTDVPKEFIGDVQGRVFKFLWKNKQDKIKRTSLYQDYEKGGLRMIDMENMIKALRLAWIPRLLKKGHFNWKTIPDYYFKKCGGLDLLLSCNYRVKDFEYLPRFYKDILLFFDELRTLYGNTDSRDTILYHNKVILIGAKPFFFHEWFSKGVKTVLDLLDSDGNILPYNEFKSKYSLEKTNFLQYYQVVSAIPNYLLQKGRELIAFSDGNIMNEDLTCFPLDENNNINLLKIKSKDFYWLLVNKLRTNPQTGPKRWIKSINPENICWKEIFQSVHRVCVENKLREFHFKFIHRIIVTRKRLRKMVIVFIVEKWILLITAL